MSEVKLFVYDLSQGMARQLSPALLGKQIDGIWHSAIAVFDREYYFGGGICVDAPGATPYGTPAHTHDLGRTAKSVDAFLAFLASITARFTPAAYHLLDNNCNHFSDACAVFLTGARIPAYVRDLPQQAMDSPLGPMLRPMVESMQAAIVQQSHGHELSLPTSARTAVASQPQPPSSSQHANLATDQLAEKPVLLTTANVPAIARKLAQFDPALTPALTTGTDPATITRLLAHARDAPHKEAFPALDLLRLAVASTPAAATAARAALPELLERHLPESGPAHAPAAVMVLRVALNLHAHADCAPRASELQDALAAALCSAPAQPGAPAPPVTKTGALLALNVAGAPRRATPPRRLDEADVARLLFTLHDALGADPQPAPLVAAPLLRAAALLVDGDADAAAVLDAYGLDADTRVDDEDDDVRAAARLLRDVRARQQPA